MSEYKNSILNATKWSTIAEVAAKLVTPLSNMILARLLTPEAFGIVATATMIFSFADMFTDSGFQKYLVQHEFKDENELEQSTTVAFWTNMFLSLLFWIVISIFSGPLATLVGNPGLGEVFIVACISLPLTSFSSIQMSLYRRTLDFKTLFYARFASVIVPFFVTIPLAFITRNYWALIIGTICGNVVNAVVLTMKSSWKPHWFFRFSVLKEMLSFSIWSLVEAITIWLTNYIGIFIVGVYLSPYYTGIYKTSMNTVNQLMALVTTSTTPVLFSSLSRVQDDKNAFEKIFFEFQRNVGLLVVPMGIGIFIYRDFVTDILLGSQWKEASGFIGLWGLVNAIKIVLSNYCSEAYRAKGKPKVSVAVQISQIVFLIPMLIYGAQKDFTTLYVLRCMVSVELIIANLIIIHRVIKVSSIKMIGNFIPEFIASLSFVPVAMILKTLSSGYFWTFISIIICVITYFVVIISLPWSRKWFIPLVNKNVSKILTKIKK